MLGAGDGSVSNNSFMIGHRRHLIILTFGDPKLRPSLLDTILDGSVLTSASVKLQLFALIGLP